MHKYLRFFLVGILFFSFLMIRIFEDNLFYDPFIKYFKNDYLYQGFPKYDTLKLYLNLIMRYTINGIISIFIIYLLFKKEFLKFSIWFYFLIGLILFLALTLLLNIDVEDYKPFFYVRRFIIQPLFILLLLPAFYYQKQTQKKLKSI